MNAVISIILLAVALGVIVLLFTRRENTRRSQYGPAGLSEFRTDLPLDECFDRLDLHSETDEFAYECRRENDGGFLLHLTLHQPTQQPLDTLYTLRLDPGRQTIVTLIFIRESFGYKEPLFPQEMLACSGTFNSSTFSISSFTSEIIVSISSLGTLKINSS